MKYTVHDRNGRDIERGDILKTWHGTAVVYLGLTPWGQGVICRRPGEGIVELLPTVVGVTVERDKIV